MNFDKNKWSFATVFTKITVCPRLNSKMRKLKKIFFAIFDTFLYNKNDKNLSFVRNYKFTGDEKGRGIKMEYKERKRLLFFGLPWTFTKYTVKEEVVVINSGLLKTYENDCYMYKIQDVELQVSLIERIFGLGTVACFTGDNTHPKLNLIHIKHAKEIKDYILKTSEEARRKRRTLNTLNIGSESPDDETDMDI